jgi:hypothetical protein
MNTRTFSCFRRRPHIVDLLTPVVPGVSTYTVLWAQNFDGIFAPIINCSNVGFYDDNIPRGKTELQNTQGFVRMTFDPTTFGIDDTASFWLQLWETPVGGASTRVSASSLLLPDSAHHGIGVVTIAGNAPGATVSTGSMQLDMPRLMQDWKIHNQDSTNYLYVATEQGGPEMALKPDTFPQYYNMLGVQGSIWVRGASSVGAAEQVAFSATASLAFPK